MQDALIIASISYVFRSIKRVQDEHDPAQAHVFDAANDSHKAVTNLGWLLRHSGEIVDLWVSTYTYRSLAIGGGLPFGRHDYEGFDAILGARLEGGLVYATTWADRSVLHDWLKRPNLLGRPVHWDCVAYIVGDRDYERLAWERAKRLERERTTGRDHA